MLDILIKRRLGCTNVSFFASHGRDHLQSHFTIYYVRDAFILNGKSGEKEVLSGALGSVQRDRTQG